MSDMQIALVVSVVLYVLVVGPVLAACLYATRRAKPDAIDRAATDVQHFIDLREHARAELAETGSLDDFIAIKAEARKHLWRPAPNLLARTEPSNPKGRRCHGSHRHPVFDFGPIDARPLSVAYGDYGYA